MTPARFFTDSSLDFLARRLRFLGYDVTTVRGARLEELLELAGREGGIVLTRSARHPRRFGATPVLTTTGADAPAELRTIAGRYAPAGAPFSRCPACNVALRTRHPLEARGEIPGRVFRAIRAVAFCPMCGKWYWEGSHVARIRAWLESALGRPLVSDAPGGGPPREAPAHDADAPRDSAPESRDPAP